MSRYCKHGNIADMCQVGECHTDHPNAVPAAGSDFHALAIRICHTVEQRSDDHNVEMRDRVIACLNAYLNDAGQIETQRAALAEARKRIIARYEQVDGWLKQPAPDDAIANWAGITEGLRQARRIIGAMWDELPVKNPYQNTKDQQPLSTREPIGRGESGLEKQDNTEHENGNSDS